MFDVKFKENNKNDMKIVVWAGTVFGPRLWQLSARRSSLAGFNKAFNAQCIAKALFFCRC